ncbi:hypothetical protein CEPID_01590 [Corynebacterium epidermidicanis]|uniref:ECF transporter S component n=2 Tax=Corynebacterium epidermidicanis TaxID=1050174 RepID=A0A0G3GRP4_9CORY|nr:hypothetical protein CEPID_01590 [Corynebacterium epidermidicanis]
MDQYPRWLPFAMVAIFAVNWAYLVATRPPWDGNSYLPGILQPIQVIILMLIAAMSARLVLLSGTKNSLALIGLGVVLDLVIGGTLLQLEVPLYLDTIGSVLVAVILGPSAGGLTATISQGILSIMYPPATIFYMINVVVGWAAGLFAKMGGFTTAFSVGLSGLVTGVLAGMSAAPLMALGLGDAPIVNQTNPEELLMKFYGIFFGALTSPGAISDVLDKILVFGVVSLIARWIAQRFHIHKPVFEYRSQIS